MHTHHAAVVSEACSRPDVDYPVHGSYPTFREPFPSHLVPSRAVPGKRDERDEFSCPSCSFVRTYMRLELVDATVRRFCSSNAAIH